MENALVIPPQSRGQISPTGEMAEAGQVANQVAARQIFDDYRSRKAAETLRRQEADLALFAEYLDHVGVAVGDLVSEPAAWQGATWGLAEGFVRWQLQQGYAIGSVNVRLATVKVYVSLASKAGMIDPGEAMLIRSVKGYGHREGKRIDRQRPATRVGQKKAQPVTLTAIQAERLKDQPATPQGRRDALLMCLLLDHGLRCGEAAALSVEDFDLDASAMRFYRSKVDLVQVHRLTDDALRAARVYLQVDALVEGPLFRKSSKDGRLHTAGMSERAITARVETLGLALGIVGLSAHDCRHYWATQAVHSGTPLEGLQQAGGWSSLAMPLRYIEAAKVANQSVKLE